MAAPRPKGTATASAMTVTTRVAVTRGTTPKWASANVGDHSVLVRSSTMLTSAKNSIVGGMSATTMPRVVATETMAAANSNALITASPGRGRDCARDLGPLGTVAVGLDTP